MTTSDDLETQQPEPSPPQIPYYVIDLSRAKEFDRSLPVILLSRRCPSCRAQLESSSDLPPDEEQIKEIASCCSTQEGYIRPEMPMQEIIFRTLLSGGNQRVSLEQLHYLVTDRWYTPNNPRNISIDSLKQVLDHDSYYGFQEVPGPSDEH